MATNARPCAANPAFRAFDFWIARQGKSFNNQGPRQVRQLDHLSTDGGDTWTVSFDLTYVRKK